MSQYDSKSAPYLTREREKELKKLEDKYAKALKALGVTPVAEQTDSVFFRSYGHVKTKSLCGQV